MARGAWATTACCSAAWRLLAHAQSLSNRLADAEESAAEAEELAREPERRRAGRRGSTGSTGWPGRPSACSATRTPSRTRREGCGSPARTGQDQFAPLLLSAQALGQMFLGSLPDATALATEALETARIAANDYVTCSVLTASCHVALAAGDVELARRTPTRASRASRSCRAGGSRRWPRCDSPCSSARWARHATPRSWPSWPAAGICR